MPSKLNKKLFPLYGILCFKMTLGIVPELFTDKDVLKDVNSIDTTLMERVALIDSLTKEEQKTIFSIMDAFLSKRKLKSTLKTVLQDIE